MLYKKISEDLKNSMKNKDSDRLETIRLLFSQIKNKAIDSGTRDVLSDDLIVEIVKRRVKQGKDSLSQYQKAGRKDLVEKEQKQLDIILEYMPTMMSLEEIEKVVLEKKNALGINDISKMGQLMGAVMTELKGKADGSDVKNIVQKNLI